ncbi:hypothetical protein PLICRDRAFT_174255 [Plicaturopsis crispa FD-325 SS-3]|nr:hypothetical protein PLICRDRAFT_174255 [Plicaturopsis crispa FD-325 SS-3]
MQLRDRRATAAPQAPGLPRPAILTRPIDVTATHSRPPTKRRKTRAPISKRLRRGGLSLFVSMPHDVVLAVASELAPRDLYNLAYINKEFARLLLAKSSSTSSIWKRALASAGLPPCPDGLTLPAYTRLAFFKKCTFCSATVYKVCWMLKLRCCERCKLKQSDYLYAQFQEQGIPESFLVSAQEQLLSQGIFLAPNPWNHMLRPLEVYGHSVWEYYLRSEADAVLLELKHTPEASDGLPGGGFLDSRAKVIGASTNFARMAKSWQTEQGWVECGDQVNERRMERRRKVSQRTLQDFYQEWPIEVDYLRRCPCTVTEWSDVCYNPLKKDYFFWTCGYGLYRTEDVLPDDEWEALKPKILRQLSAMRQHLDTKGSLACVNPYVRGGQGYLY